MDHLTLSHGRHLHHPMRRSQLSRCGLGERRLRLYFADWLHQRQIYIYHHERGVWTLRQIGLSLSRMPHYELRNALYGATAALFWWWDTNITSSYVYILNTAPRAGRAQQENG